MNFKKLNMIWMCKRAMCVLSLSLLFLSLVPIEKASAQDDVYASYDEFYTDLANYGQWIDDPQYGYVWSPNVDGSFRPYYTNGYWVMTEYGNTWVSDFPWGWAAFHYGRWTYDQYYGWLWIPGSQWAPAWVSWRYGEGFYGWAPLGPGYQFGSDFNCPNDWWVFIPPQYLYSGSYYRYWYGPRNNGTLLPNTNYVTYSYSGDNHNTYYTGPRQKDVENYSHQPVQVYHLARSRNLNTRVHNNVVRMYHPSEVKPATSSDGRRASPPNVVSAPQPVRTPQPVKTGQSAAAPSFRNSLPKNNGHVDPPGANINQTAEPQTPQPKYNENPYEYDVNRPVPQPPKQEPTRQQPAQQPAQPSRQQPQQPQQPVQTQQPRPQPAPQPAQPQQQQPRQQPAPQPQPAQQPAQPRPQPTPQPAGGRR